MKKGYWVGQVKEIKNEEKWGQYLEKFMNIVAEEAEKKLSGGLSMEAVQAHTAGQGQSYRK